VKECNKLISRLIYKKIEVLQINNGIIILKINFLEEIK